MPKRDAMCKCNNRLLGDNRKHATRHTWHLSSPGESWNKTSHYRAPGSNQIEVRIQKAPSHLLLFWHVRFTSSLPLAAAAAASASEARPFPRPANQRVRRERERERERESRSRSRLQRNGIWIWALDVPSLAGSGGGGGGECFFWLSSIWKYLAKFDYKIKK
jgi:hypothetical protein